MGKVAFVGKMRSGKTTAAEWMVENRGYTRYAFGDEVKIAASGMMNALEAYMNNGDIEVEWDINLINEHKKEPGIRQLIQITGDELGRSLVGHSNVWVHKLIEKVDNESSSNIVVDDVRYPNEFAALMSRGFRMIRIERVPERERVKELKHLYGEEKVKEMLQHPSEMLMDDFQCDEFIEAKSMSELIDFVHMYTISYW